MNKRKIIRESNHKQNIYFVKIYFAQLNYSEIIKYLFLKKYNFMKLKKNTYLQCKHSPLGTILLILIQILNIFLWIKAMRNPLRTEQKSFALKTFVIIQFLTTTVQCLHSNIDSNINISMHNISHNIQIQNKNIDSSTIIQGFLGALGMDLIKPITSLKSIHSANIQLYNNKRSSESLINSTINRAIIDERDNNHFSIFNSSNIKKTDNNIISFINRGNILKYYNINTNNTIAQVLNQGLKTTTNKRKFVSCSSCQLREKHKLDSLESIKTHILMRLQLPKLPNITSPIPVPHNILDKFYKNFSTTAHNIKTYREGDKHIINQSSSFINDDNQKELHNSNDGSGTDYVIQSDDPDSYNYADSENANRYFEYTGADRDSFFSRVESVYIFPTISHIRNNRKVELLNFNFDNNFSMITRAIIHIYIRGREWSYERKSLEHIGLNENIEERQELIIDISRAERRSNSLNYTHTVKIVESRHKIPPGLGQWIQIELKQIATHLMENHNSTLAIIIKGTEPWMHNFIVTYDITQHKSFTVNIELFIKETRRKKRSTSLDCHENDQEVRCCRYPLKVNFTDFGWHFVVAPTSFDAYFCNGECKVGYLEQYTHTHIASLTTSAKPCCSPTKMSPLSLLYFNLNQILMHSTIPNMSVEKCSCS